MTPFLTLALVLTAAPELVDTACPPDAEPGVPLLAVTLLPGFGFERNDSGFSGTVGAEVRLLPFLALRSGYEGRSSGHVIDFLGAKLAPFPDWRVRPFVGTGVSGVFPNARPGESFLALTVSGGVDVTLGAGFFVSVEGRARFMKLNPQAGVYAGLGFEFL